MTAGVLRCAMQCSPSFGLVCCDLQDSVYLRERLPGSRNQCDAMQESVRLRPVLPVVFRRAMKDVQFGPYLFPEGAILELHTLAMNTHPHHWERPDDFLPVSHAPQSHAPVSLIHR